MNFPRKSLYICNTAEFNSGFTKFESNPAHQFRNRDLLLSLLKLIFRQQTRRMATKQSESATRTQPLLPYTRSRVSSSTKNRENQTDIDAPIILGRCPSLSTHESESMLRTYLVCRKKQKREKQTNGKWEKYTVY
jgi:hypothetical protein